MKRAVGKADTSRPKFFPGVLRGMLWLLDGVLVLLFVAGYLGRYVPPVVVWWFQLLAIVLPYLSLLLLIATAGVLLARRRWAIWLHLALVVLMGFRFIEPSRWLATSEAEEGDFSLMTFNAPDGWEPRQVPKRAAEILHLVATERPDLIGLQDATFIYRPKPPFLVTPNHLGLLVDSLGYQSLKPFPTGNRSTSAPILSLFPADTLFETLLRMNPEDPSSTAMVRCVFHWQGRPVALYNLHLRTYGHQKPWNDDERSPFGLGFWKHYLDQYREAILRRAWEADIVAEHLAREPYPILVTGDFNSTPHNWTYQRIAKGLQDTFGRAGQGGGYTYHSTRPFVRIDFILAGPEWEVVSANVLDAAVSDHRPVIARVRWRR